MQEFKNEAAREIVEVLRKHGTAFFERKQGGAYRSIYMALAHVFKEDFQLIQNDVLERPKAAIETGGATIIRKRDEIRSKTEAYAPCDGCGDQPAAGAYSYQAASNVEPDRTKVSRVVNPKDVPFTSAEDVQQRFEGKELAMKAFAQKQKINIPSNVTRPATIAELIFEHYEKPTTDQEEEEEKGKGE